MASRAAAFFFLVDIFLFCRKILSTFRGEKNKKGKKRGKKRKKRGKKVPIRPFFAQPADTPETEFFFQSGLSHPQGGSFFLSVSRQIFAGGVRKTSAV